MIISTLTLSERIEGLNPSFKKLFDFVKQNDLLKAAPRRIELVGNDLFINNSEVELLTVENQVLEIHERYIDVHIPLDGPEIIGWKPAADLRHVKSAYDEAGDFAFYTDKPDTYITLQPGQFVIIYPEDAHAPIIGTGKLRKLVAKIKIN